MAARPLTLLIVVCCGAFGCGHPGEHDGQGAISGPADAGPCGPSACTDAPTGLVAFAGAGFILARWSKAGRDGVSYTVTASAPEVASVSVHTTETVALIGPDLVNGIKYSVAVVADTAQGNSQPSAAVFITPAARCTRTFAFYRALGVGTAPLGMAVADLTGDGHADIAVANQGGFGHGGSVSVLVNRGFADFAEPVPYDVADFPATIAVADVDGDGRPDLVAAGSRVTVLFNHGNGNFGGRVDSGSGGRSLAVADFNRDGRPDIATASENPELDAPLIGINAGDGTFRQTFLRSQAVAPAAVATADWNGDGKSDLVAAYDGEVDVFLGNGDGSFAAPIRVDPKLQGLNDLAIADFDGDGTLDVAVGNEDLIRKQMAIVFGGPPPLRTATFPTGVAPFHIATADIDHDGKPDLAFTDEEQVFGFAINEGGGSFAPVVTVPVVAPASQIALGDVNGDGYPDAIISSVLSNSIAIYLNVCGD
jgi:hypothetical protein